VRPAVGFVVGDPAPMSPTPCPAEPSELHARILALTRANAALAADLADRERSLAQEVVVLAPQERHGGVGRAHVRMLPRPWDAKEMRESIDITLAAHLPAAAPPTARRASLSEST